MLIFVLQPDRANRDEDFEHACNCMIWYELYLIPVCEMYIIISLNAMLVLDRVRALEMNTLSHSI